MKTGIELFSGEDVPLHEHHKKAILNLYVNHGVKEDLDERLVFWENDKYYMSHNPSPEERLAILEEMYLNDEFPLDFEFL